jgi:hypothetical protein
VRHQYGEEEDIFCGEEMNESELITCGLEERDLNEIPSK